MEEFYFEEEYFTFDEEFYFEEEFFETKKVVYVRN